MLTPRSHPFPFLSPSSLPLPRPLLSPRPQAVSALLYGPRSLSKTTAVERRTAGKSSWAKVWGIESVTPGLVALAVTIVRLSLSLPPSSSRASSVSSCGR